MWRRKRRVGTTWMDPSRCENERPISVLSTSMKLLETIIEKRLKPKLEPMPTPNRYTYRRERGSDLLLANSDSFAGTRARGGQLVYVVGLDKVGAFDTADLLILMRSAGGYPVPRVLLRYIGNWVTARSYRIRPLALTGQHLSEPSMQNKRVSHGGSAVPPNVAGIS